MGLGMIDALLDTGRGCTFCFRVVAVVLVGVFGLLIASKTSGLQYYSLVPEDDTFGPYCRLIVFPESQKGEKINFFEFGGQKILDTQLEVNLGLTLSMIGNNTGLSGTAMIGNNTGLSGTADIRGRLLGNGTCDMAIVDVADGSDPPKVMIMNARTKSQMQMKPRCGGETPGKWVDKGNESTGEGMWMFPVLSTCVLWIVCKLCQLGFDYWGFQNDEDKEDKWLARFGQVTSGLVSLSLLFFISPLTNMEVLDCPQLVTTWYSGIFQTVFAAASVFFILYSACLFCFDQSGLRSDCLGPNAEPFHYQLTFCILCLFVPAAV